MNNRFDRYLRLGYGFSILILLLVGGVSYFTLNNLLASNRAVAHSSEVVQKLEKLLSVMKDAETGQRGYLLTGRDAFLEPYRGAYPEAENLTKQLAALTGDNPRQQQHISNIRLVLYKRLNILQRLISKKQKGEAISADDLDAGKAAMDALRDAVARAENDEKRLLQLRTATLDKYTGQAPFLILLSIVFAAAISGYSYRKVTLDVREKDRLRLGLEQSEAEAQALNEELTAANEEITAANEEITAANEELIATNDELRSTREELAEVNQNLEKKVHERTKALQESEGESQALNEELTAINEELAATNEELIATNQELAYSRQQLQVSYDELRLGEERSAKLAAIVESSDDAIIGKNLDGIITAWNRGAELMFGYTEAEIVGQPVLLLIPENLQHEEPGFLARLRSGEKIDHYETTRRTSDGRLVEVSLTISPIRDKEGRVTGVSKIARDITEQKRDEQRKNDFIGMASHELRTPLTSLNALLQVLELKLKNSTDTFVPNALAKATLQARKMTSMVNGFLNVSRLESGKLVIDKQPFDITALIREQIGDIRLTVSSHTFVFESEAEITVSADHDKIGSVISNLLSNAVKYSPRGKSVTVNCERTDKEVRVSVKDEGVGIRASDLPRIFERYYRAGSENTRHISGFGVGLYLCAEIIQHHGGRIWAESELGQGSVFYFSLPVEV